VLIDAGPGPLREILRRHGVKRIDLLVLSHGHADHSGGLDDILGRVPVSRALIPDDAGTSESLARVRETLAQAHVPVTVLRQPSELACGQLRLDVLPTGGSEEGGNQGENDRALVCVVTIASERVLLPGDAEGEALEPLDLRGCAVVELPHHGSAGGFTEEQLDELQPRLAVISVGENRFGHPTAEMLSLLAADGIPCLRTDTDGEVELWEGDGRIVMAAER
jgi:competence protein ComEC